MKRIFCLILILLLIAGCSNNKPKGDPSQVIQDYISSVKNEDYDKAHSLLDKESQERYPLKDFVYMQELFRKVGTLVDSKSVEDQEHENYKVGSEIYEFVVEFTTFETVKDFLGVEKERTEKYKNFVISEGKTWKLYKEGDVRKRIAQSLVALAWPYVFGDIEKKNANEAIRLIKESFKYASPEPETHFTLGIAYVMENRLDEARKSVDFILNKSLNAEVISLGYSLQGLIYEAEEDFASAIASYKKAIQKDNQNDFAKSNLIRAESYANKK